jgi:undecaprenyl-diphosphatase
MGGVTPRLRPFLLVSLLAVVLSALTALGPLTLLHAHLEDGAARHFDLAVQLRVHGWSRPWLTAVMLALTWIGSVKIFATSLGIVLGFLVGQRHRHAAALLGLSMLGAFVLNESLKLHFHRPRPTVPWSIGDEHTYSFPSGHSLFSFVLYGTLAYLALHRPVTPRRRVEVLVPAILLPLGIGLSRIYLGMHYPTDVLAGYLTGAVWLVAVVAVDHAWHRRASRALPKR